MRVTLCFVVLSWCIALFSALQVEGQTCNKGPCYRFVEQLSGRCQTDCDCDGARRCSAGGKCKGIARAPGVCSTVPPYCTDTCFYFNEAGAGLGANKCADSCECDGARTCSGSGFCQGTARAVGVSCGEPTTGCTSACYRYNEQTTQSKCMSDCMCDGKRSCSGSGFCQGVARNPNQCTNTPAYCTDKCFIINEAKNPQGASKCGDSCDCDGARTCSFVGFCQGVARPPGTCGIAAPPSPPSPSPPPPAVDCTSACYRYNEQTTQSKCTSNCMCDGKRLCSASGFCQGVARNANQCTNTPAYCTDKCFIINEARNPQGPSKCGDSCDCDGARTCSFAGFCQGVARPPGTCGIAAPPSPPSPVLPPPQDPCAGVTVFARGRREFDARRYTGTVEIVNSNSSPLQLGPVDVTMTSLLGVNGPRIARASCLQPGVRPNDKMVCTWRIDLPLGAFQGIYNHVTAVANTFPVAGQCRSARSDIAGPFGTSG